MDTFFIIPLAAESVFRSLSENLLPQDLLLIY